MAARRQIAPDEVAEIAGIPLVVITATGKRPVLIDAAELVMKPLDLTQLFSAIERYCQ